MIPEKCPHCGMAWNDTMGEYECGSYPAGSSVVRATACTEIENIRAEIAELRKAAKWIVECEKWDEGSRLLNEKALAQARLECKRASEQVSGELPPNLEEWMMLVARKQGRDESATEIARLQAQLSQTQAEREQCKALAEEYLREIVRTPKMDSAGKFQAHVRVPGCVGIEHAHPGEYWIDLDMMADRIRAIKGLEIVPASRVLKDGEVAVSGEELEELRTLETCERLRNKVNEGRTGYIGIGGPVACLARLDALRAQGKEGAT